MKVIFVGLGNLGSQVFDLFLLRNAQRHTVMVAGKRPTYLRERTGLTTYSAMQLDLSPDVQVTSLDVLNVDQTAQTLSVLKPDILFCALTLQPWLTIRKLPPPVFDALYQATTGPWLPLTLTPVYKLMQAVKQSGINTRVMNGSFPDTINAVLGKVGLAPTIGIGNLANAVPALRQSIALDLGLSARQVELLLYGHHGLLHKILHDGDAGSIPFHLRVYVNGEDRSHLIEMKTVFARLPTTIQHEHTQMLTAGSAVCVIEAMTRSTSSLVHAPGPAGLVGAYPVRIEPDGALEVVLPEGLTLADAIGINEEGQRFDGIEQIEDDGTVWFMEKNMAILKDILGYDCRRMPLSEVEGWAKELQTKYRALASKYR
jgi:hypothetical protein